MKIDKKLYPQHPVRCIITGPNDCGKSVFLTNLISYIINEYDKIYIYSPSLYQDLYQKIVNCFNNYIPVNIIPTVLNEKDFDLLIDEVCNDKDFVKSDIEIETYEAIEGINFPKK